MIQEQPPQPSPRPPRKRNPLTRQRHKKDVFWQITVPLVVLLLILFALGGLVIASTATGGGTVSAIADTALVWMALPTLFVLLVVLLVLGGVVYAVMWIINVLPPYFKVAHDWTAKIAALVKGYSARISDPVIEVRARAAAVGKAAQRLRDDVRKLKN